MGIVPKGRVKRIAWYRAHAAKWLEDAAGLGLTPERVEELQALVEEASVADAEQQRAYSAARSATLRRNSTLKRLSVAGSSILLQIRATASRDRQVYFKAQVPLPRKKSPVGKPGRPYSFNSNLDAIGCLELSWKCKNPKNAEGTMYRISRRIDGIGPFMPVGFVGKKKFRDETVPAGVTSVMYKIQAVRSTSAGPWALFDVSFGGTGISAAGEMQIAA